MSLKNETNLVLLAQVGDIEALDELFKLLQMPLYRYIYGLSQNQNLAQDILQEVFISIYRRFR